MKSLTESVSIQCSEFTKLLLNRVYPALYSGMLHLIDMPASLFHVSLSVGVR